CGAAAAACAACNSLTAL
ncbi:hypothetical protein A2U01_0100139, partial [Trifolium medium]|nr:hypothetical protein [Trifolium medium]